MVWEAKFFYKCEKEMGFDDGNNKRGKLMFYALLDVHSFILCSVLESALTARIGMLILHNTTTTQDKRLVVAMPFV